MGMRCVVCLGERTMRRGINKRVAGIVLILLLGLTGCGVKGDAVSVISREDGSGTRGAFVSLFEIEALNEEGEWEDETTLEAVITNSTAVMMQMVGGDPKAIGYLSLGSLQDTVKAVKVDGVYPSAENLKNGTYPVARPFLLVKDPNGVSDAAEDFLRFLTSADGQRVLTENGYGTISGELEPYREKVQKGKVVLAGSSSVAPVMEKVKEAYCKMHPGVVIEIQQSDSTTGIQSALDGTCDFGMTSRSLKASEEEKGCREIHVGTDGIAVIVNLENPVDELSKEEIRRLFTGTCTEWNEITKTGREQNQ